MAKRKRSHRRKKHAKKNSWFNSASKHRKAAKKGWRKRGRRNPVRRGRSMRRSSNPIKALGKVGSYFRLPTLQELLWVTVGSLGIPTVNRMVTNLIPLDAVKSGWGNIVTELAIGSAASGLARRYAGNTAGDVLFILVLARAIGRSVNRINPALGFAAGGDELGYYQAGQLGYADVRGFGDVEAESDMAEALPEMS